MLNSVKGLVFLTPGVITTRCPYSRKPVDGRWFVSASFATGKLENGKTGSKNSTLTTPIVVPLLVPHIEFKLWGYLDITSGYDSPKIELAACFVEILGICQKKKKRNHNWAKSIGIPSEHGWYGPPPFRLLARGHYGNHRTSARQLESYTATHVSINNKHNVHSQKKKSVSISF